MYDNDETNERIRKISNDLGEGMAKMARDITQAFGDAFTVKPDTLTPAQRERLATIDSDYDKAKRGLAKMYEEEQFTLYRKWQQRRTDVLSEGDEK